MQKIRFLFFFILGLLVIHWVYKFFAGPESIELILDNKYKLFLLAFAHIPSLYFDSLAWVVLMGRNKLSIYSALIITWISQTSSKFIPTGNITGEVVRFYLAKNTGQNSSQASSTVLMDLFIATFSLLIVGLFTFLFIVMTKNEYQYSSEILFLILAVALILFGCIFFFLIIRKRIISKLIKTLPKIYFINKRSIFSLLKLDLALFKLSFQKKKLIEAMIYRLIGWIGGAFEIYVFLWIIGVDAKLIDVILIESVTAIIRSVAFFIPAGLGVQEFAFVMIGEYIGYSGVISFSVALGRRLREIMVGVPAIFAWFIFFKKNN